MMKADGRITRRSFWIASLILIAIESCCYFVPWPVVEEAIYLVLIYPWVCIYAKRLHDLDRSGLLQVPAYVVAVPSILAAWAVAYVSITQGLPASQALEERQLDWPVYMIALTVNVFVNLGFFLWLGIARGKTAPNRFGPAPGAEPIEDVFA